MTSSPDMVRSDKAPRRAPVWRKFAVAGACLAVLGAVLFVFLSMPRGSDPQEARAAMARSLALLQRGNVTAARYHAAAAVRADPNWGLAHALLARTQIALGDGLGAEAEIGRATAAGFAADRSHHLLAMALVLQGEYRRALAEAAKAPPRFRAYALRAHGRAMAGLGNLAAAQEALELAVTLTPRDAGAWVDLGRFRYNAGDVSGAVTAATRGVDADANSVEALQLRGELVRAQYGLTGALPWFEGALKRDPWNHDVLIEYAATLGDAGQTQRMLDATRKALLVREGSPQAYYLQAVLAARASDFDLARSLLAHTGGAIDDMPGVELVGAILDLDAGATEQAIEKLKALVGQQPMNITARKLLAVALLRSDAARNAIDTLRPVVARSDADSYALLLVARGLERIGDRATASRLIDRAAYPATGGAVSFASDDSAAVLARPAGNAPGDPQAAIPYIRALIDAGNKPQALAQAQRLAAANPGAPGAHLVLGDVLMLLDRAGDAVPEYKRAADLRFDEPSMLRLVEAQDRAGARRDAANTLALFLAQNPVNSAALRLSAHWQLAGGEYEAAVRTLEDLNLRLGDGDAGLDAELAYAYSGLGKDARATDMGQTAYLLQPNNPAIVDAYGWALFQAGDVQGAREVLQKAVSLAPNHPGLKAHLAAALQAK